MPPTTLERGSVRVVVAGSYDVRAAGPRRTRGLPGEAVSPQDALFESLGDSGLTEVQRVDLTPRRTRDLEPPSATATVEVGVDTDEDAVVLLERDGVYSWHLPRGAGQRTRSLDRGPRTVTIDIDLGPETPPERKGTRARSQPSGIRERGLLGDLVEGAVQAVVLKFVAPLVDHGIRSMEAHVQPGLVHLRSAELAAWQHVGSLAHVGLPSDREVRVLLFVHGTFSSTAGGFGALGVDPNGMGFLGCAIGAYDAVIGWDHKTLSVDPRANAREIVELLRQHQTGHRLVVDIITHSRGGLTTRSLLEYELPGAGLDVLVDNVVFVAATNAGTHLADPERWNDLLDLTTNLALAGAGALAAVPGAGAVAAVVAGVVKGIGAFVKYLVAYGGEDNGVPGLAAMMPNGKFIKEINAVQKGQPRSGETSWYVISSDFHVELLDDSHHPPEFPRELVVRLKEGFVDRLFRGENDLVVDTASMSAIGLPQGGGYVKGSLAIPTNDVVYHSNYFGQLQVIEALSGWLPLGLGAGGGDESAAAPEEPAPPEPPPEPPPSRGGDRDLPMAEPPRRNGGGRGAPPAGATPPVVTPPAEQPTDAKLAAEMPSMVQTRKPFEVRVILSRNEIRVDDDAVAAFADVSVDAARPVSVQVVGKVNCEVVGKDSDVFGLPFGGGESALTFQARPLAVGPVVVHAVVRQGWVPVQTLELKGEALTKASLGGDPRPVTVEVHRGIDAPELDGLPCLDIIESRRPDGTVVFKYAVRVERGAEAATFESAPIHDRAATMAGFVQRVQEISRADISDATRLRRLQDTGSRLYDLLLPEDMQAHLWQHRDRIADLIVYTDEPYVPWELLHLKPPRGNRPRTPRFLAQGGLVRWRLGSFPPREIRVRRDRARWLIPDYRDPRFALPEAQLERDYLERHFGAREVAATPAKAVQLLRGGRFDLLHFSGHGAADPEEILGARVLLQGRKRGRDVEAQYLTATEVSENVAWADSGQAGPLVVLNACQVGADGLLLTTAGGFADAFLDAGAAAFVSCLWNVHDAPSRTFVERLYDELLAGTPMARATARARAAAREAGDATWLAFAVYARPDAVLTTG